MTFIQLQIFYNQVIVMMKQYPNNLKFKKYHKKNKLYLTQLDHKNFFMIKGNFAIQAIESGKLTFKQIEACRRTLRRGLGKLTKMWIRLFTYCPVTSKSIASRMGKGKGNLSHWMAPVKKGQILFEILCDYDEKATLSMTKAITKLPVKSKILNITY